MGRLTTMKSRFYYAQKGGSHYTAGNQPYQEGGSGHYTAGGEVYQEGGARKRKRGNNWSRQKKKKLSNQVMLERMGVDPTAVNLKKEAEELDQLLESPTKSKAAFPQRILPKKQRKTKTKKTGPRAIDLRYLNMPNPEPHEFNFRLKRAKSGKTLPKDRAGLTAFLNSIRPNNKRTRSRQDTHLYKVMQRFGTLRRKDPTLLHTHTTGWYMHGKNAGMPRPGVKAAMIREATKMMLDYYKNKRGTAYMKEIYGNARGQRGRGQKGGFLLDLIVNGGKAIGNLFSTGAKAVGF